MNFTINAYIDKSENPWFEGKELATLLGYKNANDAIIKYVDEEDKISRRGVLRSRVYWCTFLNESEMYSLILRSKLDAAKKFKRWVTKDVLPSIRKQGFYNSLAAVFNNRNNNVFKIENEYDLHTNVIGYIKKFYPNALLIAGLCELQDTDNKRIKSFCKGYQKRQPDLIITNLHKHYSGLCIEFKTPKNNGTTAKLLTQA